MSDIKKTEISAYSNTSNQNVSGSTQKMQWDASSVFSHIDKNNDGTVTGEEAKEFGFTFMRDGVDANEFKKQFDEQQAKLADNKTSLADFDSCFNSAKGGVIKNVPLSKEQQHELLKRVEMYEAYKSTLSDEEKTELEKNKHAQLDFAQFNDDKNIREEGAAPGYSEDEITEWETEKSRSTRRCLRDKTSSQYNQYFNTPQGKYAEITTALKNGSLNTISNEDLAFVLNHTDTTDLLQDGKIGSFTQGQVGDCWFLSQLNNYASTEEGAKNLADRIQNNGDGSYTVKFQNPFNQNQQETYEVSKKELENFDLSIWDKDYSAGDLDVRIYEVATQKMLEKYLPDTEENRQLGISCGKLEKCALVHKALGYEGDISKFVKGKIISDTFVEETNTGSSSQNTENCRFNADDPIYEIKYELGQDENGKAKITAAAIPTNVFSFTELTQKRPEFKSETLVAGTSSKDYHKEEEQRYIQTGHAYNLESIDNSEVRVNDPYLSAFPHQITGDDFEKYFSDLTYFPLTLH